MLLLTMDCNDCSNLNPGFLPILLLNTVKQSTKARNLERNQITQMHSDEGFT